MSESLKLHGVTVEFSEDPSETAWYIVKIQPDGPIIEHTDISYEEALRMNGIDKNATVYFLDLVGCEGSTKEFYIQD